MAVIVTVFGAAELTSRVRKGNGESTATHTQPGAPNLAPLAVEAAGQS